MEKLFSMGVKTLFIDIGSQGTKQGKFVFYLQSSFNTIGGLEISTTQTN